MEQWFGLPHDDREIGDRPGRAARGDTQDGTLVFAPLSEADADLVEQLRGDDELVARRALEQLHVTWAIALARYVERLVHASDVADDIVQDVFLAMWLRRADVVSTGSLRAYLYGAVHRRALQVLRNARVAGRWAERVASEMTEAGVVSAPSDRADTATNLSELAAVLHTAIEALPVRQREAFLLYRERELSLQDVAQVMGISVNTVKVQIQRAGITLRAAVERYLTGT
jgi:RNA polymerase sigma-70 factor (ECF subfamily)